MSIAIIGAGVLGSNLARALAQKNIPAMIASRRGPEALKKLTAELGASITPVTVEEASKADIVVLALRWADLETVLRPLPAWQSRIVIDATNPVEFLEPGSPEASDPKNPLANLHLKPANLQGQVSSELVAKLVQGARIVKAFNHLPSPVLSQTKAANSTPVLFYSGDDADAKAKVAELIAKLEFVGIDVGALATGGRLIQFPGGPLAMLNLMAVWEGSYVLQQAGRADWPGGSDSSVASGQERVHALLRTAELTRKRYDGGEASQLDVINAERLALNAQVENADKKRALPAAQADLFRALGGGWDASDSTQLVSNLP